MKTSTRLLLAAVCCAALAGLLGRRAAAGDEKDKIKELIKSVGFVEIKLIEAHVPDLDLGPAQGDSDVFVRVFLNDTKEMLCETQVIQDNDTPKFDKECRTNRTVPSSTVLRIELYDSDKPIPNPEWIGMVKIKISELILSKRLDSKETFPIEGRNFPKYFIKAKIDFKPPK